MWLSYLVIMAGGALGVGSRMAISLWIANHFGETFPWGTFVVNVLGCFIIGLFSGLTGPDATFLTSPLVRQTVTIGFLGGFTTYSSFSLQTVSLLMDGEFLYSAANIILTLLCCLVGTWGGLIIASALQPK